MRRFFYSYPEPLPSPSARTVTVVKSCASLQNYFDLSLITTPQSQPVEVLEKAYAVKLSGTKIIALPRRLLGVDSTAVYHFHLRRLLDQSGPLVIYVRHLKTAAALLRHRRPAWKIVYEAHEVFYQTALKNSKRRKVRELENFVYHNVDGLVFIAETLQADINRDFSITHPVNQVVLPLGFDAPVGKPSKDFSQIAEIFYVGSLQKWKGVGCLIEAMRLVPAHLKLNLMGRANDDVLRALKKNVAEAGLGARVTFLPPVPHHEAIAILKTQSRLCVLPNIQTAFDRYTSPLKLFEYMGTNNIIIYSDIPAIRPITSVSPIGIGFEAGNVAALARAISAVCAEPQSHSFLAENAFQVVRQFTWDSRAQRLANFIAAL